MVLFQLALFAFQGTSMLSAQRKLKKKFLNGQYRIFLASLIQTSPR